ncbi:MAG: Fur family transcriptional regulator [Cyclobacteriaceae bacterium]
MSVKKLSHSEIKEILGNHELKATSQRLVIYSVLSGLKSHPSTEDVYNLLKNDNPSISLATVYKTLETFVSAGLCRKVMSKSGSMRYDSNVNEHGHIYCENTEEIIDYEDQELDALLADYFNKKNINNLTIKEIKIQINGDKIDLNKTVLIQ